MIRGAARAAVLWAGTASGVMPLEAAGALDSLCLGYNPVRVYNGAQDLEGAWKWFVGVCEEVYIPASAEKALL
jgi:hypothetical protein